ncbi:endonuclease VII domain-containing protein [Actinomadura craniellae]|nr:endonuclease VII domain-containing protein [Actinomadura craniellae]
MAAQGRVVRERLEVPHGHKYCPKCCEIKSIAEFGRNRAEKSGLTAYCKPCHNKVTVEIKNRVHGSVRNYLFKYRYGITVEEVDKISRRQGGICVICLREPALHVDHDHQTGLVRGLLCFGCNGGLGQFQDEAWRLRRAAGYLDGRLTHFQHMELEFGTPTIGGLANRGRSRVRGARADRLSSARHYKLRAKYGIDERDEQRMLAAQRGLCAICANEPGGHVDHDHESGAVRGVLCLGCNSGMGQFKDDAISLLRAADYLDGFLAGPGARSAASAGSWPEPPGAMAPTCRSLFRALDGERRRAAAELAERAGCPWDVEAVGLRNVEVALAPEYPHGR